MRFQKETLKILSKLQRVAGFALFFETFQNDRENELNKTKMLKNTQNKFISFAVRSQEKLF